MKEKKVYVVMLYGGTIHRICETKELAELVIEKDDPPVPSIIEFDMLVND